MELATEGGGIRDEPASLVPWQQALLELLPSPPPDGQSFDPQCPVCFSGKTKHSEAFLRFASEIPCRHLLLFGPPHCSTLTNLAPALSHLAPTLTYTAPTLTYLAPTLTYLAPTLTSLAPALTSLAPTLTQLAPTLTHARPEGRYRELPGNSREAMGLATLCG